MSAAYFSSSWRVEGVGHSASEPAPGAGRASAGQTELRIAERPFNHSSHVAEILRRISTEEGGSVFALRRGEPRGWMVAITNNVVGSDLSDALRDVWTFAVTLARLNPAVSDAIVIGWWRSQSGQLFLDVGMALASKRVGQMVGRAFVQEAIAGMDGDRIRIVRVASGREAI